MNAAQGMLLTFRFHLAAYYMTLWYRPNEVSSRLGITYLAGPVSGKLHI